MGTKKERVFGGGILLLGILAYFKYTNFFLDSLRGFFGWDFNIRHIILPIGISFYVFSALSYLIDVYRGNCKVEKNIINCALYIAFFPKITAGPIVRGKEFFSQARDYRGVRLKFFSNGIQIFVLGLFKKIVLADHLGVFVDDVFFAPTAYNTGTVILAVISYSLQIYFDFSGYSDMAIGIAKMIGFDFNPNFNIPYMAQNMSDFWRRWHISLSAWFRDYVYIPLGGSRKGEKRACLNLMITMLLSGLWHGAGWTFIIWGFLHGVAGSIDRLLHKMGVKIPEFIGMLGTFIIVTFFWVIFRAENLTEGLFIWKAMLTVHSGISQQYTWTFFAAVCLALEMIVVHVKREKKETTDAFYPVMDLRNITSLVIFFTFIGLTIILGYFGNTVFIYGKF